MNTRTLRPWQTLILAAALFLPPAATAADYGLASRPTCKPYLGMPPNSRFPAPAHLSQTGAFKDVRTLTPADGLIPYDLNVSFWSDGAAKRRWAAIPSGAKIGFAATGEWTFPAGTVFVKHFELPSADAAAMPHRLETRLLVRDDAGGVYGVSYRWRADQSDADLVFEGHQETIRLSANAPTPTHPWYFPGPQDCATCHTQQAGLVLGVKTRQMNRDFTYAPHRTDNQLRAWNHVGLFDPALKESEIAGNTRLVPASDAHAPIEARARSYLDANCAQCHRPGGVAGFFDARYDTPLARQNLIDGPVLINLGLDHARVIAPHDVWRSVLLARITELEQPKMPPLAHETLDASGIELITQWIQSLAGPEVLPPPTFSPAGGEYKTAVKVEIRHPDSAAVLHYTLDGEPPNLSSPIYRGPLELSGPVTLRARAYKQGATRSIPAQETYIVGP